MKKIFTLLVLEATFVGCKSGSTEVALGSSTKGNITIEYVGKDSLVVYNVQFNEKYTPKMIVDTPNERYDGESCIKANTQIIKYGTEKNHRYYVPLTGNQGYIDTLRVLLEAKNKYGLYCNHFKEMFTALKMGQKRMYITPDSYDDQNNQMDANIVTYKIETNLGTFEGELKDLKPQDNS